MAMDFDLDDPLGDLLSDGSNDSFFGSSKKPEQASVKKSIATKPNQSSSAKVANLFGIENDTNATASIENASKSMVNLNAKSPISSSFPSAEPKTMKPTTPKHTEITKSQRMNDGPEPVRTVKKETTQFEDSDDFLNELGFDPKHPKGTGNTAKKSNILDDILNFSKTDALPKASTSTMPSTPMPKSTLNDDTDSRRSTKPIESTHRYSPSLGTQGRPRRTGSSGPIADTLGLFSTSAVKKSSTTEGKPVDSGLSVRSKPAKKSGIDWLGLDDDKDDDNKEPVPSFLTETTAKTVAPSTKPANTAVNVAADLSMANHPANTASTIAPPIAPIATGLTESATDVMSANLNLVHVASLEKEQALHSLQQQQTQLRVAAQMKQQETVLHDMHRKQQMLIRQQENQFSDLLQRQINRQNQLETQIQQQQEQINAYLGTLMSQPSIGLYEMKLSSSGDMANHQYADAGGRTNEVSGDDTRQHAIELEAEVKRLSLEKLRLEDTVQSVQTAHEQELDLLQTSHKKQIALLEENLQNLEMRLRDEIKSTETYHLNKISALQTDMTGQQHKYEEHIEKLIGDYEKQMERLRLNYEHDLEALNNDQRSTIENIRQAKLFEFAAVQESGSYIQTLKSAFDNLELATDNLQSLRTNIDTNIERVHAAKEIQLDAREKRLNEQQKQIDKTVEKTEEERTRLIELIKSLEIKLNSVEQTSTEEQWNLRQKAATLDAERVAFEREKTFTRDKHAADEKRIQELKDAHLAEHKRLMDVLDADREQFLIEKAKLETLQRLKPTTPPYAKRQTELDAAIQIAQDAAKSADTERGKFVEQQRQFELKKRELLEKESELQSQQNELQLNIAQAKDQKHVAEHATRTCKALEQKLLAKLQSLQESYMELTQREAKLSQAKMELGRERMELQGIRQQLRQSKCSLCRIGVQNREISELDPLNDIDSKGDGIAGPMDHCKMSLSKFDIFSSNSFDGLQQRLLNVDAMIDDVIISAPQSPKHRHLNATHSLPIVIDPF